MMNIRLWIDIRVDDGEYCRIWRGCGRGVAVPDAFGTTLKLDYA